MDTHKDEITRRPPATKVKDSVEERTATRSAAQTRPPLSKVPRCSDGDGSDPKRIEAASQRPQAMIARPTERQARAGARRATSDVASDARTAARARRRGDAEAPTEKPHQSVATLKGRGHRLRAQQQDALKNEATSNNTQREDDEQRRTPSGGMKDRPKVGTREKRRASRRAAPCGRRRRKNSPEGYRLPCLAHSIRRGGRARPARDL